MSDCNLDKQVNDRLHAVETTQALHGHRINNVETLIVDHVKECRQSRDEQRRRDEEKLRRDEEKRAEDKRWYMGIIGTVIGGLILAWIMSRVGLK